MNGRIWMYIGLSLFWLVVAGSILLGFHEQIPGLGRAEGWKNYLVISICLLMFCFNLLRIYLLRQADARAKSRNEQNQ